MAFDLSHLYPSGYTWQTGYAVQSHPVGEDAAMPDFDNHDDREYTRLGVIPNCTPLTTHSAQYQVSEPTEYPAFQQKVPFSSQLIPSREEWDFHRPTITKLYRDQRWKLRDLVEYMSKNHGLKANERMYKKRIYDWDLRRNLSWDEREAVAQSRVVKQARLLGNNDTRIIVRGQERKLNHFLRHMKQPPPSRTAKLLPQPRTTTVRCAEVIKKSSSTRPQPALQLMFGPISEVKETMYPPGDRRTLELICSQVSHLCEVGLNNFQSQHDILQSLLVYANIHAQYDRFYEARIFLNKAGRWASERLKEQSDFVLVSVIDCLRVRKKRQPRRFDTVRLFHKHLSDLSNIVLGQSHPLTIVLSLIDKIEDVGSAAEAAFGIAIDTIRLKSPAKVHTPVTRLLQLNLIDSVEAFSSCTKAEPLCINLAEELRLSDPNSQERAVALATLAGHYCKQGPYQYLRAESLLSEALYIGVDPTTGLPSPQIQYYVNLVLDHLAYKRGTYELALVYLEKSITAADEWLGKNNVLAHSCRTVKVDHLKRLERWEEAVEEKQLCYLADAIDG
jgi:tetratricopeptide (TPR) repeat protein